MWSSIGSHNPTSAPQPRGGATPVLAPSLLLLPPLTTKQPSPIPVPSPQPVSNFSPRDIWHAVLARDGKRKECRSSSEILAGGNDMKTLILNEKV